MTKILETLIRLGACAKPLEWLALPENEGKSPADLWETCPRGGWLLWLAVKLGVDRNLVTLAACDCARLALPFVPDGEDRPRLCIEITEAFTRGEATQEQVRVAAYATDAAAEAAAPAAKSAAYAAANAAYAAVCSGVCANSAADSADYAATYAAARSETLAECADLVRARISWSVVDAALKLKGMCEL